MGNYTGQIYILLCDKNMLGAYHSEHNAEKAKDRLLVSEFGKKIVGRGGKIEIEMVYTFDHTDFDRPWF